MGLIDLCRHGSGARGPRLGLVKVSAASTSKARKNHLAEIKRAQSLEQDSRLTNAKVQIVSTTTGRSGSI